MVRNYTRKTQSRWSRGDLLEALLLIKDKKCKINDATSKFGISRATLYRQFKKFEAKNWDENMDFHGHNRILSQLEEDVLEKTILTLREKGYSVTASDVKRICFEYCQTNGIPHQFNKDQRMASNDWYYSFTQRHAIIRNCMDSPCQSDGKSKSKKRKTRKNKKNPKRIASTAFASLKEVNNDDSEIMESSRDEVDDENDPIDDEKCTFEQEAKLEEKELEYGGEDQREEDKEEEEEVVDEEYNIDNDHGEMEGQIDEGTEVLEEVAEQNDQAETINNNSNVGDDAELLNHGDFLH